jgi:UDP-N-acetylmuramate--alanine ligase
MMRDWMPEFEHACGLWAAPPCRVHLAGAGGVGMAGLAELLRVRGFQVSGCDGAPGRLCDWLAARGIPISIGHDPAHAEACDWFIRTTALPAAHPEPARARALGRTVTPRGIALAALAGQARTIAIAGTHGKTTTTTMTVQLLRRAGLDPAFAVGGESAKLGGVAGGGSSSDLLVIEADESDGTLAWYAPAWAVVTNVDFDHMEHFSGPEAFHAVFERFIRQAGEGVLYGRDDPVATRLCAARPGAISFGEHPEAEVRAVRRRDEDGGQRFVVCEAGVEAAEIRLPLPGRHNALNALAALAMARRLGADWPSLTAACAEFEPPRRRMECVHRGRVTVYSDYAHHPAEIRALLSGVRGRHPGARVLAIFQPHRYTRTRALGPDFPPAFDGLDHLILTPVYAASEAPLPGGSTEDLLAHFRARSAGVSVESASSLDAAWTRANELLRDGDLLLLIGAGDVERLAGRAPGFDG